MIDIVFLVVVPLVFFVFSRALFRDSPYRRHHLMPYVGAVGLFLTSLVALLD